VPEAAEPVVTTERYWHFSLRSPQVVQGVQLVLTSSFTRLPRSQVENETRPSDINDAQTLDHDLKANVHSEPHLLLQGNTRMLIRMGNNEATLIPIVNVTNRRGGVSRRSHTAARLDNQLDLSWVPCT
jgi:hypothetical protein